jgi:DmsE family decaheme c-type cytochrome
VKTPPGFGAYGATASIVLALGLGVASANEVRKPVDWVSLNPAFEGASFVNDAEACKGCHEDTVHAYAGTAHERLFRVNAPPATGDCESCHGPRSEHVDDPDVKLDPDPGSPESSRVCLQCHETGDRFSWKTGAHHLNDVSCSSCHYVMAERSERALLAKPTESDTCFQCHAQVRVEGGKMSHHPVREGRMECEGCHNAHGSTPMLLAENTVNETCYKCHAELRGPYVWEHAPARESCLNCHTPHGSNQRSLLTGKDPFLCLSCHSYGGHINLPRYNRVSNPYGSGCSNCHVSVHGSNHPSGAKLTR